MRNGIKLFRYLIRGIVASVFLFPSYAMSDDDKVYGKFPITVKGYSGNKTSSTAYTGQIARHILHDSLKKLAGKGNGKTNPKLEAEMLEYYSGKSKNRPIIAPKGSDG